VKSSTTPCGNMTSDDAGLVAHAAVLLRGVLQRLRPQRGPGSGAQCVTLHDLGLRVAFLLVGKRVFGSLVFLTPITSNV
jgi:hypothetical protein